MAPVVLKEVFALKIRVKFRKEGAMVFVGHLDLLRYFQKAFRRSLLDIRYSQGYNPHQVMSFAMPLGVGVKSNGEYMDVTMNSVTSSKDFVEALGAQMAEGVDIVSVVELDEDSKNAMTSVAGASYYVDYREGYQPDFDFEKEFTKFMEQDKILVIKKTKKSEKEMDLKEHIHDYRVTGNQAYVLVDAGSVVNIKPNQIMEAFYESLGKECGAFTFVYTRDDLFMRESEEGPFLSLLAAGKEFE